MRVKSLIGTGPRSRRPWRFVSGCLISKGALEGHSEHPRDSKRNLERGRVLLILDGDDRLPRYTDSARQLRLRHFAVLESELSDLIPYSGLSHIRHPGDSMRVAKQASLPQQSPVSGAVRAPSVRD